MNLGAFMNPEFPIFSTTLCYLERDDAYLMLHLSLIHIYLALGGVVEGTWLHQWSRTSGLSQCWALEPTRSGRTRIRNVLADKYIDLVGMNTANGAQAQIWNFVAGGNQEWTLERIDPDTAQSGRRAEEAKDPQPTPSQRKHQNDLVRKLNNAGKGRASRKGQ